MARQKAAAPRVLALLAIGLAAGTLLLAAAREPANDFHFSIIGDRTGGHHPGIYERVWREVGLLRPDFAVNVGDTIEGYIRDEAQIEAVANRQWDEIDGNLKPYAGIQNFWTPGNHDIWDPISERVYQQRTGAETNYSFRYQSALFVVLDNSRVNELSDTQYEFLDAELAANADASPTFVFFHKPFWMGFVAANNTEHRLHQICKARGVDWVFTGHGHTLVHNRFDGVEYLQVGSSGGGIGLNEDGSVRYNFAAGKFFHHVWARVKGSSVELTVHEIQGGGGQGRTFDVQSWQDNKPLFAPDEEPFLGEAALNSMRFQSPADGAAVPRGTIPIVAAARANAGRPPVLRIDGAEVTPDAGPFVAAVFDVSDLHSLDNIDMLRVNGEEVARLSPERNIITWETMIVPFGRDLWQRRTPGEVTLSAGTTTDGTGQNLPENNDDYWLRQLLVYDGTAFTGSTEFPADQTIKLGDSNPDELTLRTFRLDETRVPANLTLLLHAWETGNLPAGAHTLELLFAGRSQSITVNLE